MKKHGHKPPHLNMERQQINPDILKLPHAEMTRQAFLEELEALCKKYGVETLPLNKKPTKPAEPGAIDKSAGAYPGNRAGDLRKECEGVRGGCSCANG
jgi:hypothetical protein